MTSTSDPFGGDPDSDEIRIAIDRIIVSDVFNRSPQLGAFLRFVTEAVLHGKADRIKAYTIGVEVLRRDAKFDPQLDPIVRVEATRLRRALERYYAGPGASDDVVIDLPRGSYVPTFRRREVETGRSLPLAGMFSRWSERLQGPPTLASLAAIAAVVVAVLTGIILYSRPQPQTNREIVAARETARRPAADAFTPGNGMPTIYIEPLRVVGTSGPHGLSPEILFEKINDAFTRFDTVNVIFARPQLANSVDAVGAEPRSDYRLSGGVEYSGDITRAWFKLVDTAEGNVVWSRLFERIKVPNGVGSAEQAIVVALTNSLLQSYGVIRARDRAKHLASNAGDPRYRCILEAADALRTADRGMHDRARDCLEKLTALDPGFAVGFTFLALTYNREFQLGYQPRSGDSPPLERALRAVRQSIALNPESSRGYLALMVVQFNRRDIAGALAAGDKCLSLNGYDMLALGEYGGRLIMAGDIERGLKLMEAAGAHGAVRPAWHHIYMFIGNYINGDRQAAARHAGEIVNDNVALGQVALALAAQAAGDPARARRALDRLIVLQPNWRDDPRRELGRLIADRGIVDRLARDLAAAGLPGHS